MGCWLGLEGGCGWLRGGGERWVGRKEERGGYWDVDGMLAFWWL